MKIAIAGLGRMGSQIARKLAADDHQVIAHNRSPGPIEEAATYGAQPAPEKSQLIQAFDSQPVCLWLMLPAEVVDQELDDWLGRLPPNSLIIDGGNSNFKLTMARQERVRQKGMRLMDVGTSGGVWGLKNGFSLMAGGDAADFKEAEPALKTLAAPGGAYAHFGPTGSGHYVKMVHNAIEYGMMESLAEGYRMLREGAFKDLDLATAGQVWQHGSVVTSWLNELCRQALSENPSLEGINGQVAESGEARWTLETARELGIELPAIQTAFDIRLKSQAGEVNFATKLLAAMRHKFGGHDLNQA